MDSTMLSCLLLIPYWPGKTSLAIGIFCIDHCGIQFCFFTNFHDDDDDDDDDDSYVCRTVIAA